MTGTLKRPLGMAMVMAAISSSLAHSPTMIDVTPRDVFDNPMIGRMRARGGKGNPGRNRHIPDARTVFRRGKWSGADLRAIRARNGVGRPPRR